MTHQQEEDMGRGNFAGAGSAKENAHLLLNLNGAGSLDRPQLRIGQYAVARRLDDAAIGHRGQVNGSLGTLGPTPGEEKFRGKHFLFSAMPSTKLITKATPSYFQGWRHPSPHRSSPLCL